MQAHRNTGCPGITLRASDATDVEFLYRVYAASRDREMALLPHWGEAEKEAFLRDQFRLQHAHYHEHYPNARFDLVCQAGEPIGRLYVAVLEEEIRLMDVALLAAYRGRGIGAALIADILDEARASGRSVSLHVEPENRALRLYARLGFVQCEIVGAYRLMRWSAVKEQNETASS